jgi:transposase
MIQITPQMRVLVAIEAVDGRRGIDSLARLCQEKLAEDPFSGCVFVFRSRSETAIRLLGYDCQGYRVAQKRLSKGRLVWWPEATGPTRPLEAYAAQLSMAAGDHSRVRERSGCPGITARRWSDLKYDESCLAGEDRLWPGRADLSQWQETGMDQGKIT